jgi:para-nitrobenzyl esterase
MTGSVPESGAARSRAVLRWALRVALLKTVLLWPLAAAAQVAGPVKIDTGLITGTIRGGVNVFKGIPYAAPPVGEFRWRAPQPAAAWSGIRVADRFGFVCVQVPRASGPGDPVRSADMSEDCLTLNVFAPTEAKGPLPVMVWIHGGGFTSGSSAVPSYDGEAFARGGVVLVSINYRLGRLGVFAHPALTAENADGGRLANYGLMDQIAALQWVARNIAAFGGDPDNVTIFGESAGGLSVNALMVAPEARGLFNRAISQSGYGRGPFSRMTVASPGGRRAAETEGQELATAVGVPGNDLAALRAVPATAIVEQYRTNGHLFFVLDGKVLPHDMWAAFRAKLEAPVPFMLGSNSHEFPGIPWSNPRPDLHHFVADDEYEALAEAYGDRGVLDDHLISDFLFTQQARALARLHSQNGYPTFLYLFSVVDDAAAEKGLGARHGAEIPYVFDTLSSAGGGGAAQRSVAGIMNATWRAFAATGEPNGADLTSWPDYASGKIMDFALGSQTAKIDPRNDRLDALSAAIDDES